MYKQSYWFIDHTCWCKQEGTRQLHLFRRPSSTWVLNDWLGCHFSLLLNFPRMNFQVCHNQCRRWEEKKRKRADIKVPGEDSTFKVGAARSTWQKHTEAEKGKQSEGFHHHPSPQKISFFTKSTQLVSPHSSVVTGRWVERSKEFAGIPLIHMIPTKPPIWSKWKPQLNLKLSFRPPNQSPKKLQLRQVWDLPCSGFF